MADKYFQEFRNRIKEPSLLNSINSIKQAVEKIWAPDTIIVQDYKDHGLNHSERIFEKIYNILWLDNSIDKISENELYVLILSGILHDIGLQCDIKKYPLIKDIVKSRFGAVITVDNNGENTNEYSKEDQEKIIRNHHLLTAAWLEYIFLNPNNEPFSASLNTIPIDLRDDVIDVCRFHFLLQIENCPETSSIGHIRTRFLAALLRIGDNLDVENYNADINAFNLFGCDTEARFWAHLSSRTKICIENHAIKLCIFLNEHDYNICAEIIQRKVISNFNDNNRGLTEILRAHEINIGISEQSHVSINRFQQGLPQEIINYIMISLDIDPYLRKHLNGLFIETWRQHPSCQLMQTSQISKIDYRLYPEIVEADSYKTFNCTEEYTAESPVWTAIRKTWESEENRPIIIQGEGGLGKTVSIFSIILNQELSLPMPVLYIQAIDLIEKNGNCLDFAEFLHVKYPEDHQKIGNVAKMVWRKGPRLLLLFDGLNEVRASRREEVLAKILEWRSSHLGAQIIIVSRPVDYLDLLGEVSDRLSIKPVVLTFKPLHEEIVRSIIQENHRRVPSAGLPIWKDLVYPLFLNLYLQTGKLKGRQSGGYPLDILDSDNGGALIWNYFQRELLRYSTNINVGERAKWVLRCSITCELISPAIAYYMVRNHLSKISIEYAKKIVDNVLDTLGQSDLPRHLKIIRNIYNSKNLSKSLDRSILSSEEWYDTVFRETGILVRSYQNNDFTGDDLYQFKHQHFRDCLAGLFMLNETVYSNGEYVPSVWRWIPDPRVLDYCAELGTELMSDEEIKQLWQSIRKSYLQANVTGENDYTDIYCVLNFLSRRPLAECGLDFSGLDIRGLYLSQFLGLGDVDLQLFRNPEHTRDTTIDISIFRCIGHDVAVTCLVALQNGYCISGSCDSTLRVWNPATSQCLKVLAGHEYEITCLDVFPNGKWCISGSADGTIRIWNPLKGVYFKLFTEHTQEVSCVIALSNSLVISGSIDGSIRAWNPEAANEKSIKHLTDHTQAINCLGRLSDGRFVSGSSDCTLRIWDTNTWDSTLLKGHTGPVTCVSVLSNGNIISGSDDDTVRIWDSRSGDCLHIFSEHFGPITCLTVFSLGEKEYCISGSKDYSLRVWDISLRETIQHYGRHNGSVTCAIVLPGGHCVSGSVDNTLHVWNALTGDTICTFEKHNAIITGVCAMPDGRLISASLEPAIAVWDPSTGKRLHRLGGNSWEVTCVSALPNGNFVSGSSNGRLYAWNYSTEKCIHPPLCGHTKRINCLAVLNSEMCVTGSDDTTLRIWNLSSGKCEHTISDHESAVLCVSVLSDDCFASGSYGGKIVLHSFSGDQLADPISIGTSPIEEICVLDNQRFLCRSKESITRVWWKKQNTNVTTKVEYVYPVYSPPKVSILLSSGKTVYITTEKYLSVKNGSSERCIKTPDDVNCLAALPGDRFVSGLRDNTLLVWDAETLSCIRLFEPTEVDVSCMDFSLAELTPNLKKLLERNLAKVPQCIKPN